MNKWVYRFGKEKTEGNAEMRNLLGGKGCNLAEMSALGLPVPPGFTITTEVCDHYYKNGQTYPKELETQVDEALNSVQALMGRQFGNSENPLLVSVRSGARVSMPGMMDTVLNLGLNDDTVEGLARESGDDRFAWDSYRRFMQMYGNVVLGIDHHDFEEIIEQYKRDEDIEDDTAISADAWREIVKEYKSVVHSSAGSPFPMDPRDQLWGAIGAVFGSWMTPRAVTYRRIHHIPESWGTAVNIQSMVFGNMGEDCLTGVAFTRNPSTGANDFYGEYLVNAQGEDVVAGIRTPVPISEMKSHMQDIFSQLMDVRRKLEIHFKDMQDIEFTVEKGQLYMLQTRTGKRSAAAALKIATDMVNDQLITREDALLRIEASALDQLLHPALDPDAPRNVIGKGLPASPGAASGTIVLSADEAEKQAKDGKDVILVRVETSPEDIHGMHAAKGILTTRGGMTSHAAVVARGMGRPCVSGAGEIRIDMQTGTVFSGEFTLKAGDYITIDGTTGEVMEGRIPTLQPELSGEFATVMHWADQARRMDVRTNAETGPDCKTAKDFGAQGIGLCRTEHMFFEPDRIQAVREMIFAETYEDRKKALQKLLPEQKKDFLEIFRVMEGLPVTIRLLDPPLHEFIPHEENDIAQFSAIAGIDKDTVRKRLKMLEEANPMLGHRGCRLGLTYPEIYKMQVQAILEAALEVSQEGKKPALPEVMVPLVMIESELVSLRQEIEKTAADVFDKYGRSIGYSVGTMIELPRAALTADEIARQAEFFSFGTNDLTQTTLGVSRDDSGMFLPYYVEKGLLSRDPFETLDKKGVGLLIEIAAEKGRKANPEIKLGICGEHGGDPASIDFCEKIGLDYISCSPYRVPIARLAAAQAAIRERRNSLQPIAKAANS